MIINIQVISKVIPFMKSKTATASTFIDGHDFLGLFSEVKGIN
jgi:hypothetical protein